MLKTPLVSIIIPTFNRAHLIGETLNSVIAQNYSNWECIVIDDGSTDTTEELLEQYCNNDTRFQYHKRPSNLPKGGNASRNYGFELSRGELINWFDDDDVMLKNFIELKVSLFKNNVELVVCSAFNASEKLVIGEAISINENANLFRDFSLWKLQIFTNSVMFKRSFLEGKELFIFNIKKGQETELFSRLFFQLENHQYIISDIPTYLYRKHGGSKTFLGGKKYVKTHYESKAFIWVENLKRVIYLKDIELIKFLNRLVINLWVKSIIHFHKNNFRFIMNEMSSILKNNNKGYSMLFIKTFIIYFPKKLIYKVKVFVYNLIN